MTTVPHTTPIRNSCSGSARNASGCVVKDNVDNYLRKTLTGLVHRELGIVDFVKLVYDFAPERIPNKEHLTLLEESCIAFCNANDEIASYGPLEEIIVNLNGQLFPDVQTTPLVLNLYACKRQAPKGDYGDFTPDFFLGTGVFKIKKWTHHHWRLGLGYGEVKRSGAGKKGTRQLEYSDHTIDLDVLTRVSIDQMFVCKNKPLIAKCNRRLLYLL